MPRMDSKRESPLAAVVAAPPAYDPPRHAARAPRWRPRGEFKPGSLRTLAFLVAASWAVIAITVWAL